MSRGPTKVVGDDDGKNYARAFRDLNLLINQERSWSGNERNRCFINTNGRRFVDASSVAGLDFLDDGRAFAQCDWDGDGDLDLFQVNRTAPQIRFLKNSWNSSQHWISLKLIGTKCNRDAIGARVRIYKENGTGVDVETVRAGNSFLSQSSRRLHFGLGGATKIDKVEVTWPKGGTEEFHGLVVDRKYQLTQGSGEGRQLKPRKVPDLKSAAPAIPQETAKARVVLGARALLPLLEYSTFSGGRKSLEFSKPTFIQIWASWCPICQTELKQFVDYQDPLKEAGLDVVLLSVDGVGADESTPEKAQEAVARLNLPFSTGLVTETLLDKLQLLRGELFSNSTPFPVPTSFLVDSQGQLVAIYLGSIEVPTVIEDVNGLFTDSDQLRGRATELKGRWFTNAKPVWLSPIARAFHDAGYEEDAKRYSKAAAPQVALSHCAIARDFELRGDVNSTLRHFTIAMKMDPKSVRIHNMLGKFYVRKAKLDLAHQVIMRALRLDPKHSASFANLGIVLDLQKKPKQAVQAFENAIRLDPENAHAHTALGRLFQLDGKLDDAQRSFLSSIRSDPDYAPPYVFLGIVLSSRGELDNAITMFQQATAIQPEMIDAYVALGQVFETQKKTALAAEQYRKALAIDARAHMAAMRLSWMIATGAEGRFGTPQEAVDLAFDVARFTRFSAPQSLDALAVAFARVGKFDNAVSMAKRAIELNSDPVLEKQLQERLELFKKKRPFLQD